MCNLSWTPHSNLEKDNSLKTTPVLAQRWAVWSILTKKKKEEHMPRPSPNRHGTLMMMTISVRNSACPLVRDK